MNNITKKFFSLFLFFLFLLVSVISTVVSRPIDISNYNENESICFKKINTQELDLLHSDTKFEIKALEDTPASFNVSYVVPLNYGYQTPIILEIGENTDAKIINYQILNDTNYPNQIINFTIEPMKKDENATIFIDFWVLVKNNDYKELPRYVRIPRKDDLPEETKIWIEPTKPIQSDHFRIKLVAKFLRGFTTNLQKLARRVAFFTAFNSMIGPTYGYQDALSTLKRHGGVCTGCANLGTALFRANGVPARVITNMPICGKDYRYDMHYISEYYCPNYGWVFSETAMGINPCEPKKQIVMRISFPEDDERAGNWGGVLLWFWTNNSNIIFPYLGPRVRRGWLENEIHTNQKDANLLFNLTQNVYKLYAKFLGKDLIADNLTHFNNAISAQQNAIQCFNQSNLFGYYDCMTIAYSEYLKIKFN